MPSPITPRRNEAALIERNAAYTQEVMSKIGHIQACLERAWGENKKSLNEVMADFMALIWRYYAFDNAVYRFWGTVDECIEHYFMQRMYKGDISEIPFQSEWLHFHYEVERSCKSLISIINNKESFGDFFAARGFPVCSSLGTICCKNGELLFSNMKREHEPIGSLWSAGRSEVFCKPPLDAEGSGCFKFGWNGASYLINGEECPNDVLAEYFSQPRLVLGLLANHPVVGALHPSSLNTLRIITMREADGRIRLFRSIFRMGVGASTVDNLYCGGVAVGIGEDGRLKTYGLYADSSKPDPAEHPDTGIRFDTVTIPYYQEAVELVIDAHSRCCELKSIGWDVAITPNGPVLVEGNIFYGIDPLYGPLREEMYHYLRPEQD